MPLKDYIDKFYGGSIQEFAKDWRCRDLNVYNWLRADWYVFTNGEHDFLASVKLTKEA